ncbi:hypothetical protein [Longitalea luteola]|uniref:hypothetical protein n=1 Tax=Longitalea luteola TaxID=2812563 RepID=UPI001A963DF6|nr:hypothetical protein [Longitalea luteola]
MINCITTLFKNHAWEFHCWSTAIAGNKNVEEVKSQLPDYVNVDWQNPVQFGTGILYPVTWIKGHKMKRKQYVGFVDGVFCGCTLLC